MSLLWICSRFTELSQITFQEHLCQATAYPRHQSNFPEVQFISFLLLPKSCQNQGDHKRGKDMRSPSLSCNIVFPLCSLPLQRQKIGWHSLFWDGKMVTCPWRSSFSSAQGGYKPGWALTFSASETLKSSINSAMLGSSLAKGLNQEMDELGK